MRLTCTKLPQGVTAFDEPELVKVNGISTEARAESVEPNMEQPDIAVGVLDLGIQEIQQRKMRLLLAGDQDTRSISDIVSATDIFREYSGQLRIDFYVLPHRITSSGVYCCIFWSKGAHARGSALWKVSCCCDMR